MLNMRYIHFVWNQKILIWISFVPVFLGWQNVYIIYVADFQKKMNISMIIMVSSSKFDWKITIFPNLWYKIEYVLKNGVYPIDPIDDLSNSIHHTWEVVLICVS